MLTGTPHSLAAFFNWFGAEHTPDMVYGDVSPVSQLVNVESNYTRQLGSSVYSAFFWRNTHRVS